MREAESRGPGRWVGWLGWATLVMLVAAQVLGLWVSAPDRDMGHLQKIMYVHVPTAWAGFLAFFVVFVWSIVYLVKRTESSDLLAASAAEVGVVFTGLTLALGSIWGRPTWGVWWTWDPRLTTTAILLLIYVGYLALRAFTDEAERRARWSAAVGILGFLNVPIVYMSVRWWATLHQPQSSPGTMDPVYWWTLLANAAAFILLFVYLLMRRYQAALRERYAEARLDSEVLEEIAFEEGHRV
jgi:heme exporter protein C